MFDETLFLLIGFLPGEPATSYKSRIIFDAFPATCPLHAYGLSSILDRTVTHFSIMADHLLYFDDCLQ